jgi:hypothetical protein
LFSSTKHKQQELLLKSSWLIPAAALFYDVVMPLGSPGAGQIATVYKLRWG